MFNIFNGYKHIPDSKYMQYSKKSTDESIKKLVSRMIEREKQQKFDLTTISSEETNNNLIITVKEFDNHSAFIFFLSISSLVYYFFNKKG
jgi:hypothetical protein